MTDNQGETLGQDARKELAQAKLLRDVIDVLKGNREALCYLPEMLQQLIDMPEAIPKVEKAEDTLGECRSEEDKAILARREKDDLDKKVKFLSEDNDVKAKRIMTLEKTIEDHKAKMLAVSNAQSTSISKDDRISLLEKTLQETDERKVEVEEKFCQLKVVHKTTVSSKEQEIDQLKNRISSLENKLQETDKRKVEIEERFDQLKEENKTTVSSKEREIDQLRIRLATLSEKRVKQDQSKVEDTLSLNRQSKVEEDFAKFFDEARVDVIDRIQELCQRKEKIYKEVYYPRLACLIFEAAYERMKEARKVAVEFCKEIARGVVSLTPEQTRHFSLNEKQGLPDFKLTFTVSVRRQGASYPADFFDALMLNFKEGALTCSLDDFLNDVAQFVWSKWGAWQKEDRHLQLSPNTYILHDSTVVTYMKACIRLAWRMVTQIPPMQIEYKSMYLQNIHNKIGYHGSPDMFTKETGPSGQDQREKIACYLWPGLLDGGGRVIRAGKVLCKIKDKR